MVDETIQIGLQTIKGNLLDFRLNISLQTIQGKLFAMIGGTRSTVTVLQPFRLMSIIHLQGTGLPFPIDVTGRRENLPEEVLETIPITIVNRRLSRTPNAECHLFGMFARIH